MLKRDEGAHDEKDRLTGGKESRGLRWVANARCGLPGEEEGDLATACSFLGACSFVGRNVSGSVFVPCNPTPISNPVLGLHNDDVLRSIGLSADDDTISLFASGNELGQDPNCQPAAFNYCGHQFGSFAGQLGDGAALSLGIVEDIATGRTEIQLKGSGKTPFTRAGLSGRKKLPALAKEMVMMAALQRLGVPTVSSLSLRSHSLKNCT